MTDLAVLNHAEQVALDECERVIGEGLKSFMETGSALSFVRENRLYRTTHPTFEAYVRERWNLTPQHANRVALAAGVVMGMEPIGSIALPTNEAQARELAKVPEPERADVWRETVERTNGKPTAAAVREVHEERTRPTPAPGPVDAAACPPADPGATSDPVAHPSWPTESELKPWETLAPTADRVAESMEPIADDPRDRTHGAEFESYDVAPQEPDPTPAHYEVGGWSRGRGHCGAQCACGVGFDFFDTLAEAREELDRHIETPEPDASAPSGAGSGEAVAPTREDGATAAPDLRGLVLAALPRGEDEALPFSPVFDRIAAGIPGVQVRHVLDVLAVMSEAGMAASKQGSRGWVWWRPEPGEQYKTDPAQRIAAVAEVAPEFVKPVAPEQVVAVEVGRNAADTLVDTVRAEVLAIIAAVDLGEDLITEQLLADLQAAVDLLASRKKASA